MHVEGIGDAVQQLDGDHRAVHAELVVGALEQEVGDELEAIEVAVVVLDAGRQQGVDIVGGGEGQAVQGQAELVGAGDARGVRIAVEEHVGETGAADHLVVEHEVARQGIALAEAVAAERRLDVGAARIDGAREIGLGIGVGEREAGRGDQ